MWPGMRLRLCWEPKVGQATKHREMALMNIIYTHELEQFDFKAIHDWLTHTYWSPGITRERVEQGFRNSTVCVAAVGDGQAAGCARCTSDTTRFGYIADVFVPTDFRGKGIAREMVRRIIAHPKVHAVETWYLHTVDAHTVYQGLGFKLYPYPERVMFYKPGAAV